MELLSPAGNVDKLRYCYTYGADAAYIGLKNFSLRVKADNFYEDEYKKVAQLKELFPGRRLHCALNISFHNSEIDRLIEDIPYFKLYPIDAFIVQDLGIVPILQKNFPNADLHLSTQASCMNREAVKMYKSIGFKRVVMGREASLKEIAEIKDAVPDMEIECFVHGAMCIAYAGRCLMSAYLNGRSAQEGFCSHTCRWNYKLMAPILGQTDTVQQTDNALQTDAATKTASPFTQDALPMPKAIEVAQSGKLVLNEEKRPDEYFPVYEGENFTAVLSSKDLCMIDHLEDLKKAGVDSLKIEGRMKSIYYVAMVTRAYRKALDALEGKITQEEAKPFVAELYKASHRPFTTAFYYNRSDADVTVSGAADSPYLLAGEIKGALSAEESDFVFKKADQLKKRRQEEREKLCPQALAALEERIKNQPDKHLAAVEKKEGFAFYTLAPLNMITRQSALELVTPAIVSRKLSQEEFCLVNPNTGEVYNWVCDGHPCAIYTNIPLNQGDLLRALDPGYKEGIFRDNGR
ncbi:MAG: U32 family peptidase [Treponema sp.]|nr:U32 family peptidase [Treponema sp.]